MSTTKAGTPEDVLTLSRRAWDAGDAEAYARLFTEDASYVVFRGEALLGRGQILEAHRELFARQAGSKLIVKSIQTTALDEDTAVVLAIGGIGTDTVAYDKFQTMTLVRRAGEWLVAAFQNTDMSERARRQYGG